MKKRILSVNQMAWCIAIEDGGTWRFMTHGDMGMSSAYFATVVFSSKKAASDANLMWNWRHHKLKVVRVQIDITPVER